MNNWSSSTYWYQYRPTYLVMQDLKHGDWLPAPPGNPLSNQYVETHGWLNENVDLSRAAFDELLRRDKSGTLAAKYRHEMDDYELADLRRPVTAPVQDYLDDDLVSRLSAGKLTAAQESAIFANALMTSMTTDSIVMRCGAVPVRILLRPSPRNNRIRLQASITLKSVRIDGREVDWTNVPRWGQPSTVDIGSDFVLDRWIFNSTLGNHRIDLDMQVDFYCGWPPFPNGRSIIHSESRKLIAKFTEVTPTPAVKFFRFVCDPLHEGMHYFPDESLLEFISDTPDYLSNLAALEMIRRQRMGELSDEVNNALVQQVLEIQKDPTRAWDGAYGDYFEAMKVARQLTDRQWQQYANQQLRYCLRAPASVMEGDPLHLDLVVLPRRGDSKVGRYGGATWSVDYSFGGAVGENWDMGIGLPHEWWTRDADRIMPVGRSVCHGSSEVHAGVQALGSQVGQ